MDSKHQVRVVWKREGLPRKTRNYETERGATRFLTLLGSEPWRSYGREPGDLVCCSGHGCGCGGKTMKQRSDYERESMPALEYARLEQREIGPWERVEEEQT